MTAVRNSDWESKLRRKPSEAEVRKLLSLEGHEAVTERWGALAHDLIRRAPERAKKPGRLAGTKAPPRRLSST